MRLIPRPSLKICLLSISFLIAFAVDAAFAQVTLLGQNRLHLVGTWSVTETDTDGENNDLDEYTFFVERGTQTRRLELEWLPFFVRDFSTTGWYINVVSSDGVAGDDCFTEAMCFPTWLALERLDDDHYILRAEDDQPEQGEAIEDLELLLTRGDAAGRRHVTVPRDSSFPTFTCAGDTCLATWGQFTDAMGAPYSHHIGLPSNGGTIFQRETSSFVAQATNPTVLNCRYFESPVSFAGAGFAAQIPTVCGGAGTATGSLYGRAGFGSLHALAGLRTDRFPTPDLADPDLEQSEVGHMVHSVVTMSDLLFFEDTLGNPQIVNRTAIFTFRINGNTRVLQALDARIEGGAFFRGGGAPCPVNATSCFARSGDWDGPADTRTVVITADYVHGDYLLAGFELIAAALAVNDLDSQTGNPTFSAVAAADFAATATLERIQVFEGTSDDLGDEITEFTISAPRSGFDYNQFNIRSLPPVTLATVTGPVGNAGWYRGPVTVTLDATSPTSTIASTLFSINGGPSLAYAAPFAVDSDGVHQVTYSSVDVIGTQEPLNILGIRIDRTPPAMASLFNLTVTQSIAEGAVVNYSLPVVTDASSGVSTLLCLPLSGSVFPVGATTVTCNVSDAAGNEASANFTVTVIQATSADGVAMGDGLFDSGSTRHVFSFRVAREQDHVSGHFALKISSSPPCGSPKPAPGACVVRNTFQSFAITSAQFNDRTVRFAGYGAWNGHGLHSFEVVATDNGRPGPGRDALSMVVRDAGGAVVAEIAGALTAGDIKLTGVR